MTEILAESYLKAEDFENAAVGVVLDEGEIRLPDETGFAESIFEIGMEINGIRFRWTMNKTSQRNLSSAWGRDAKNWVGKKVVFRKQKGQAFGKAVTIVFGYPVAVTP